MLLFSSSLSHPVYILLLRSSSYVFVFVFQPLSHVQIFANPWTAACQASLSFTVSWSLLKFMSIESVLPSNHLILCHPLLLLPSIFPNVRVFSNELALCIRWPNLWLRSAPYCKILGTHLDYLDFRIRKSKMNASRCQRSIWLKTTCW